jgi:fructose-1,6-bisphosphatase II / sedoheptulose-1,7-bisphosphatase
VIGEGERDEAPMLFIGEKVGTATGPKVDIAVDPLEGTTLCAKDLPGSIAVMAMAPAGSLLNAPDVYMDKIAIGPGYPKGTIDLDMSPEENLLSLAKAKGVKPSEITALILERPRHQNLVDACRKVGAGIRFITDGDVAGVIFTAQSESTGVDIYFGTGGAPEGVLAAAALRCVGGQFEGRLIFRNDAERRRAHECGITDFDRIYRLEDLASGDCIFAATGVTEGSLLAGVKHRRRKDGGELLTTESVVMRASTGTVRWIRAEHRVG